ncbi:glycosyltransferase family 2 protein [Aquimarina sp. W85]|uniref:glycosyltransferase family 2 protein n=1 Tax=Aquimarina rhodophyticola TaxID=3342246 RepID=UPI00366FC320
MSIVVLGSVRLYFLRNSYKPAIYQSPTKKLKVSIHLPVCSEPPSIVLKTIASLTTLSYQNFELIVVSNNTSNTKLWHPIRDKINTLDSRFKFFHQEKIEGYKAGALNFALKKTSKDAAYIFTLDSDYELNSEGLSMAIGAIENSNVDVMQFPQAYRNVCSNTLGMELNYKHYFDCYLSCQQSHVMALPTGTLTVIKKEIFDNNIKWPTDSITEDASFGIDLIEQNKTIGFCNKIIGKGTMPTDPKDYKKQFERWVFGNFQVLHKVWKSNAITFRHKIHLSTLLTAWLNLIGFILLLMLIAFPLLVFGISHADLIYSIGFVGILLHCLFQFIIFRKISKHKTINSWNGFLIHLGLVEIGAFYWMNYFIKRDKPFLRTNKFLSKKSTSNTWYFLPSVLLLTSIVLYGLSHHLLATCTLIFGLQLAYAKYHKDQELTWSRFNLFKKG